MSSIPSLPRLNIMGQRPTKEAVIREMEQMPGLGEMQAYRRLQQRMAIQQMTQSAEGRSYLTGAAVRRQLGS